MPRKPRCYVVGVLCHVITRGNNRQTYFFKQSDYQLCLDFLRDACNRYNVALQAYMLMTNHVHLLMMPEISDGISRMMQSWSSLCSACECKVSLYGDVMGRWA